MEKITHSIPKSSNPDQKQELPHHLFGGSFPLAGHGLNLPNHLEHKALEGLPFGMPNPAMDPSSNPIAYEDHNLNYYQEYCRLFIANVVLTTQMKELVSEKNELLGKLERLEKKTEEYNARLNESLNERKKRMRRTAEEIDRHFKCPVETCLKTYGSEGSLNQHIKLKHPDHYALMTQNLALNNSQDLIPKAQEEDSKDNNK